MVSHYTELQGAFGREALYRPKRYRPKDLLSPLASPALRVAGRVYPVVDISTNGAALLLADTGGGGFHEGAELDAELIVHGHDLQRIRARVVRAEPSARGVRVALGLTAGFFDLEAVRQLDAHKNFDHQLALGPLQRGALVPAEFRHVVADAVHLAQYYRRCLVPHEAEARAQGELAVRELAEKTHRALAPLYGELRERASDAALGFLDDPAVMAAAKLYTETVLTPLLLSSPMIARSYEKPLGYPGDYQVMLYYYENEFLGDTAYAKVFHKLFVEHPLSAGVCTRKDYVVAWMERELARVRATQPGVEFAVTSLGCGPAREIAEFASAARGWEGRVRFRLIDQEERTLQVAYEGAQRALARSRSQGSLECLNLSFGQLLKNPALLERGGPQHLIYSTGLFDYLPVRTAQQVIGALYACLEPGGRMLIGNAKGPNRYFFCPEFVLDWSLLYRSEAEMRELASALPSSARVELELEPGGAYWFLHIQR